MNSELRSYLEDLEREKLIDELIWFVPRVFGHKERAQLVSHSPEGLEGSIDTVGNQFFNEITKRELGRLALERAGCTHYLLMDTDEFYLQEELERCKQIIWEQKVDSSACRMRLFFKEPIYECEIPSWSGEKLCVHSPFLYRFPV